MTRIPSLARAALATALGFIATVASAQFVGTYTLVSAALPWAHEFSCTVTNISSEAVTLNNLTLAYDGRIVTNQDANCSGTNLASGQSCTVRSAVYPQRGGVIAHCRARFTGTQSGAVVGSMRGSAVANGGGTGSVQDLAVLPLQPLTGVTLSALAGQI